MKIVNLETFRKLPPNTLFAKYQPCMVGELEIKSGEFNASHYLTTGPLSAAVDVMEGEEFTDALVMAQNGQSVPMDFYCYGRGGCFDGDQLFAVYEDQDVRQLIDRLRLCIH